MTTPREDPTDRELWPQSTPEGALAAARARMALRLPTGLTGLVRDAVAAMRALPRELYVPDWQAEHYPSTNGRVAVNLAGAYMAVVLETPSDLSMRVIDPGWHLPCRELLQMVALVDVGQPQQAHQQMCRFLFGPECLDAERPRVHPRPDRRWEAVTGYDAIAYEDWAAADRWLSRLERVCQAIESREPVDQLERALGINREPAADGDELPF